MTDCCANAACEIEKLQARQSKTLKAVSALIKRGIMALFGLFVLGQAASKLLDPVTPLRDDWSDRIACPLPSLNVV
jgi:hypothetical protein